PRPESGPQRARWQVDVAAVAAYRDMHRISDDVDQLAAEVGTDNASAGEVAAATAWRRLTAKPVQRPSANERLRALKPALVQAGRRPEPQLPNWQTDVEAPRRRHVQSGPRL
ncbi:MAG: hypothetical protein M3Y06_07235, partial [Actinomycetota bacterium]|nr:hypothetical protein [Actinomycetota bacterium]